MPLERGRTYLKPADKRYGTSGETNSTRNHRSLVSSAWGDNPADDVNKASHLGNKKTRNRRLHGNYIDER